MEEVESAPQPHPYPQATSNTRPNASVASTLKRECLSISTTLQQGFRYIKAIFIGQAWKVTAKSEKEATEAELQTSKMQVDAADDAENAKKRIDKSY